MKYLKMLGLAAISAMALMAIGASTASATTLEVKGVKQEAPLTVKASLAAGNSAILKDTFGFSTNTCTESNVHGDTTAPFTGLTVTGTLLEKELGLKFGKCEREPVVVHNSGKLHISHIAGTTNGTVTSSGAVVTTPSAVGTLTCETGAGTHLGILKGSAAGHALLEINAVLTCSGVSSRWTANYTVTSPTGLGVIA